MNKLETFLDCLIEGAQPSVDEHTILFRKGNPEFHVIFSKQSGSAICYLDCVFDMDYEKKFECDIPILLIENFLKKHLPKDTEEEHFLLKDKYCVASEKSLDKVYEELKSKVKENHSNMTPILLAKLLEIDLNNDSSIKNSRPKI